MHGSCNVSGSQSKDSLHGYGVLDEKTKGEFLHFAEVKIKCKEQVNYKVQVRRDGIVVTDSQTEFSEYRLKI